MIYRLILFIVYIVYIINFLFIVLCLALADEEADYFMTLLFELIFLLLYIFLLAKNKSNNKIEITIFFIAPILMIIFSTFCMNEPLRLEGGNLKNTIVYLWLIIISQIIKLLFLAKFKLLKADNQVK